MKCPYCNNADTKVVDKRDSEDLSVIRRRRECLSCQKRFTTYERLEAIPITIVKKDGNREQFDRDKLMRGIIRACEKRPVPISEIEHLISDIEAEVKSMDSTEIPSKKLGEIVMDKLKSLDAVAYVRFASVYREFKDAKQFMKELEQYLKKSN